MQLACLKVLAHSFDVVSCNIHLSIDLYPPKEGGWRGRGGSARLLLMGGLKPTSESRFLAHFARQALCTPPPLGAAAASSH